MGYFVGPIGAYIPDSQKDLVYSFAVSAGTMIGTRIALNLATSAEIAKMASHHLPASYVRGQVVSVAVKQQARRQVGRWTVARGLGLVATSSPVGGLVLAATVLASIPPDVRDPVTGMTSYEVYLASSK